MFCLGEVVADVGKKEGSAGGKAAQKTFFFFFFLTAETAFCLMADDLNGAQHLHTNLLPSISYANRVPKGLVRKQILKIPIVNFLLSFDLT